jgi:2-methylisocitrate lyase-like PEP mutase family enzyme
MVPDRSPFAKALRAGQTVWTAGVYDALSAKVAENAGFAAVMTSGYAVSASLLGEPDVEIYTMTENLSVVQHVTAALKIPVIADTDTGYGNAINVMRTVREFERAGVSAVIFEDQEVPKRCPCVASVIEILPPEEGAAKIRAAVHARQDPDLIIVARTDAQTEEEAIARARMYVEAGADLIQPISRCFKDFAGLKRLREACGRPLSLQLLGWLEADLSPQQVQEVAGLAVHPLVGLFTAYKALQANFAHLAQHHQTRQLPQAVVSMDEFKHFIGFPEVEALQTAFMTGRPPSAGA